MFGCCKGNCSQLTAADGVDVHDFLEELTLWISGFRYILASEGVNEVDVAEVVSTIFELFLCHLMWCVGWFGSKSSPTFLRLPVRCWSLQAFLLRKAWRLSKQSRRRKMERKVRLIRRRNFPFGCMFEGVEVEGLFLVDCGEVRVWVTLGSGDCERADGPSWWGGGVPVGELGYVEHGVKRE